MAIDRYWNNTPLLVRCAASPFVETRHGYTVTQGSVNVTFSSGVKPGAAWPGSGYFSGATSAPTGTNGTMLRLGNTDNHVLGSGDWTIECWVTTDTLTPPADTGVNEFVPHTVISRDGATPASGDWELHFLSYRTQNAPNPDTFAYTLAFFAYDYSSSAQVVEGADLGSGALAWMHVAVTKNGDETQLWVNGLPYARRVAAYTIGTGSGREIRIGNSVLDNSNLGNSQSFGRSLEGYIADVRITKGYARYTRSFAAAFTDLAGPGAPLATEEDTGDYTSETFRGATGAAGQDAGLAEEGEPGEGGAGIGIALPAPTPQYDQQNETQTRRLIEAASRR